ncbi:MAG: carbohydrate ABC transporter permease [Proteobacteria bacterium]|nr:carbohydrate ABC transporter permease [Pseudomonadota bacterium]
MSTGAFAIRQWARAAVVYALVTLVALFAAFPVFYMFVTSLKTHVLLYEPATILFTPTLENYYGSIQKYGLLRYLADSLIVASVNVIVCIALGTIAAYALYRFSFRHKEKLVFVVLSARIFPSIALVLPFYLIGLVFRILDSYLILVVTFMVFNLPFVVVMMKSFFENMAPEIEEAAMLDGCSRVGALYRIVLPQIKTGLFATMVMCFMFAWNEFTYALFLVSTNVKMISTAVIFFKTERGILWGEVSALGIVAVLPVIVMSFLTQKYIIKGMT